MSDESILSGPSEDNREGNETNTPNPEEDNSANNTNGNGSDGKKEATEPDVWGGVSDEYKEKVSKFKDVDGLAKGYTELEKKLSAGKKVPETDEEKEEMYKLLGKPDKADDYNLPPLTEGENPLTDKFGETALKLGLSREQAEGVYGWYAEEFDTLNKYTETQKEETIKTLKSEWQDKYTENVELATRALTSAFPDNTIEKLGKMGLLNDHGFIAAMAKLGTANADDTIGNINPKTREVERTEAGMPMLSFPSMKE